MALGAMIVGSYSRLGGAFGIWTFQRTIPIRVEEYNKRKGGEFSSINVWKVKKA